MEKGVNEREAKKKTCSFLQARQIIWKTVGTGCFSDSCKSAETQLSLIQKHSEFLDFIFDDAHTYSPRIHKLFAFYSHNKIDNAREQELRYFVFSSREKTKKNTTQ